MVVNYLKCKEKDHVARIGIEYIYSSQVGRRRRCGNPFRHLKKNISVEHKYLLVPHVSPNVKEGSPIHCIHFKPTKRDQHIKRIKGLQVQLIAQVAFDCILPWKILFHKKLYLME
jgi:hypothetical protein